MRIRSKNESVLSLLWFICMYMFKYQDYTFAFVSSHSLLRKCHSYTANFKIAIKNYDIIFFLLRCNILQNIIYFCKILKSINIFCAKHIHA